MSDDLEITLTPEEKLRKAQGQFNALVLGMLAYLKEHGLPVDECLTFIGGRIAEGWDPKLTVKDFIREEGAFLISIGCSLRSLSGGESRAEAVFSSWPPDADWTTEGFLSFWGLSQEDADTIWDVYGPISSHLGSDYQWQRVGDKVTLTFTRRQ